MQAFVKVGIHNSTFCLVPKMLSISSESPSPPLLDKVFWLLQYANTFNFYFQPIRHICNTRGCRFRFLFLFIGHDIYILGKKEQAQATETGIQFSNPQGSTLFSRLEALRTPKSYTSDHLAPQV